MRNMKQSEFPDSNIIGQEICCGAVYPLSVVQDFQQGSITELDKSVLVWHFCGFAFLLGEPSDKDINSIFAMMQQAKADGKRLVLFSEKQSVTEAFSKLGAVIEKRYFYQFAQQKANEVVLPDGFAVKPIVSQILPLLGGRIKPSFSWDSDESFLGNGVGFCAMHGQIPAAWAFSAAVSDDEIDIGVETAEQYRGKGLASAVVNKTVQYVLSTGKKPVWACHSENTASQKTAEKTGFVKTGECFTIRLEN